MIGVGCERSENLRLSPAERLRKGDQARRGALRLMRLGRQHHVSLGGHDQLRGLGDQEVHLAVFLDQAIEQAQTILRAGGAGHG